MYHHSSPPRGWPAYDYTSPPTSPYYQSFYVSSPYANASPRNPTKRHSRKSSYASPRESGWYSSHVHHRESLPQEYYSSRKHDNVSAPLSQKKRKHRASMPDPGFGFGYYYTRPSRMPKRPIIIDLVNDADDEPANMYRVPEGDRFQGYSYPTAPDPLRSRKTDPYSSSTQAPPPFYEEDVKRSRARRASTSTRTTPPKPKFTAPPPKSHRKATEDDAAKAGIAKGYCIRYWDPTEAPIILLGSVFDANSLGKWIYDWTVYCYNGGSAPMADVAGELWLLLIRLAGKVKRADECLDRVRNRDDRETLKDFLKSGARLRKRFKTLLERCEHFMLKAAERESRRGAPVSMGSNAGCEFVKSIFGRDRYLQDTEELMASMRLWDMRFDVNCESILQPSRTSSRRQSTV